MNENQNNQNRQVRPPFNRYPENNYKNREPLEKRPQAEPEYREQPNYDRERFTNPPIQRDYPNRSHSSNEPAYAKTPNSPEDLPERNLKPNKYSEEISDQAALDRKVRHARTSAGWLIGFMIFSFVISVVGIILAVIGISQFFKFVTGTFPTQTVTFGPIGIPLFLVIGVVFVALSVLWSIFNFIIKIVATVQSAQLKSFDKCAGIYTNLLGFGIIIPILAFAGAIALLSRTKIEE
ncbi:MFS transporter [[Mycoplasma] testudinis]|uniref:CvpA family protein n=1 Tax=[Mycoplasma] testudinis TaxID=33924 RepID=UPI00047F597E|nr:CvpA family protein [[Mycoplasma] testudinis]